MSNHSNIIIIGTEINKHNYLGVRTFYLKEILKKYYPHLIIEVYDVLAPDKDRIFLGNSDNYIFLPWISTLDENWCISLSELEGVGNKILFTDNYYWYLNCKNKMLSKGFNFENIFNTIAFSSRESAPKWDWSRHFYWGFGFPESFINSIKVEKNEQKCLFIDECWELSSNPEPYNAIRILNKYIPEIKKKYPDLKIISQDSRLDYIDEVIDSQIPLESILEYYKKCTAYIVSHNETLGLAQLESRICGTKIITNKEFSNYTALLPGPETYELWSFEDPDSFIQAIEKCLNYDKNAIKYLSQECYSEKNFIKNISKNLFNI